MVVDSVVVGAVTLQCQQKWKQTTAKASWAADCLGGTGETETENANATETETERSERMVVQGVVVEMPLVLLVPGRGQGLDQGLDQSWQRPGLRREGTRCVCD